MRPRRLAYAGPMTATTLIGVSGAALLLLSFILNQLHVWKDDYLIYDLCNMAGGALLVWYAVLLAAWPFAVLNGIWSLVSLRDVVGDATRNSRRTGRGFFRKWLQ
jgi:hypothetical protein